MTSATKRLQYIASNDTELAKNSMTTIRMFLANDDSIEICARRSDCRMDEPMSINPMNGIRRA